MSSDAPDRFVTRLGESDVVPSIADVQVAWDRGYWVVVGLLALLGALLMGRPFLRRHGTAGPYPHNDSIILEYVGWFLAQGNTLYADIWEIKPPLAFLPTYLTALVTGDDMFAHHVVAIAVTIAGLSVTVALTARVVGTVTESPVAGVATGLAFFAMPDLFFLPWLGYKAKILVVAFGMAGLDRAVRGEHFRSGVLAGLAVGFWQLGVLFPVLTTIYAARERSWDALRRHLAGGAVAAGVILLSLLLYADAAGFVAEVVLGPLVLETEGGGFNPEIYVLYFPPKLGTIVTLAAIGGLSVALLDMERPARQPLALGGLLVALIIVFVDFDALWDMAYPIVFTAVGVGLLVSYLPRRVAIAGVLVCGLVLVPVFAPSDFVRQDRMDLSSANSDGLPPALDAEREHVYWTAQEVRHCRFFGSRTQRSLLKYFPNADALADAPCGDLGLYLNVTEQRLRNLTDPLLPGTQPAPSATTPTRTPGASVVNDGFDYRVVNNSTVVTMPVRNTAEETRTADVVVEVVLGDETFVECQSVAVSGGEVRMLEFRFDGTSDSLSITVWVNEEGKVAEHCG